MTEFDKEFEGYLNDKKENEEILKNQQESYVKLIKETLGEDIKKELKNPSIKTIKKTKKEKFKEWWANLKNKLEAYFFTNNNDENYYL
jgi:hypothetical protein